MTSRELKLKDVYEKLTPTTKEFVNKHYNEDFDCTVSTIVSDIAFISMDGGWMTYPAATIKEIFEELKQYMFVYKEE